MKEAKPKGLYNTHYVKQPRKEYLQRQKEDQQFPEAGIWSSN